MKLKTRAMRKRIQNWCDVQNCLTAYRTRMNVSFFRAVFACNFRVTGRQTAIPGKTLVLPPENSGVNAKYLYPMECSVFKPAIHASKKSIVGLKGERGRGVSNASLQSGLIAKAKIVDRKSPGGRYLSSKRLMESAFQVLRDLRSEKFSLGLFRLGRSADSEDNLLSSNARVHSAEAEFEWSSALWEAEVSNAEDEVWLQSSSGHAEINPAEKHLICTSVKDNGSRATKTMMNDAPDTPFSKALEGQDSDWTTAEVASVSVGPSGTSLDNTHGITALNNQIQEENLVVESRDITALDNQIQEENVVEESRRIGDFHLEGSLSSDFGVPPRTIEGIVKPSTSEPCEAGGLARGSATSEESSDQLDLPTIGQIDEIEGQKEMERLKKLREAVAHHAYRYNTLDDPLISDAAYDALVKEMKQVEASTVGVSDSVSSMVGAPPSPAMLKVQHSVPMLSLASVQKEDDLVLWHQRLQQKLGPDQQSLQWVVEPKVDGLALSLLYKNGILVCASTRGNGFQGEDVTHNAQNVENIPLVISQQLPGSDSLFSSIEVRGEIYMPLKHFEELNAVKVQAGEKPFANPRNAAAGSMRLLAPPKLDHRPLSFVAYSIAKFAFTESGTDASKSSLVTPRSQWEALQYLNSLGFSVNEDNQIFNSFDSALEYAKSWRNKRQSLEYEADGVVFKVNDGATHVLLGDVGGNPRWAVAWKFAATEVVTILEAIELSVGRSGVIVPNARLKPVDLGGVSIGRATLHNFKNVKNLGLCEGDHVIVQRAGDVIPQVVQALEELRSSGARLWSPPTQCPSCGSELREEPSKAMVFCRNSNCSSKRSRQVEHFAKSLINGLGPKVLTQLQEEALVVDPSDLYSLDEEVLSNLPRFGKKSARKLLSAIEESKVKPDWEFIAALGIPRVGVGTSQRLAEHFGGLQGLLNANDEELVNVPGVGEQTLKAVFDWCRCESNIGLVSKLLAANCARGSSHLDSQGGSSSVILDSPKQDSIESGIDEQLHTVVETAATNEKLEETTAESYIIEPKLLGKIVVVTGSFGSKDREYMQGLVRFYGGKVRSTVTPKTSFVLAGENPGPNKIAVCKQLGVDILDWEKFQNLVRNS